MDDASLLVSSMPFGSPDGAMDSLLLSAALAWSFLEFDIDDPPFDSCGGDGAGSFGCLSDSNEVDCNNLELSSSGELIDCNKLELSSSDASLKSSCGHLGRSIDSSL